ncbi:hypothetical protein C3L33_16566, partial [Rhododendron williamsianum]
MDVVKPPPFTLALRNQSCSRDPVPIHSPGVWDMEEMKSFLGFALPRLQLQLAVIFLLTQSLYLLLKRFHLPRVASEIMAGFILGPTILGKIIPSFSKTLFPPEGDIFLNLLSKIGYIFFMFMAGVKMDPSMVMKSGKKAWTIGVVSLAFPVVFSMGVSFPLGDMVTWAKTPGIRFVVATQTLTPFPVVSRLLIDLQIMNSELGHLALASALIRELLSLIISTTTSYIRVGSQGSAPLGIQALSMFLITASISGFVARAGFLWIVRQTPEGKPVKEAHIIFISSVVLVSAIMCDNLGILYHYGPFLLGLFVPDGPPLGSTLVERLETLVSGWFAPLLLTYCGLHSDIFAVSDLRYQFILWTVLFGATVVKFTANFVPAFICKMPVKDAIALSLLLSGQGIVELAAFLAFRENEVNNHFLRITSSMGA